jgi:hypothetical protein
LASSTSVLADAQRDAALGAEVLDELDTRDDRRREAHTGRRRGGEVQVLGPHAERQALARRTRQRQVAERQAQPARAGADELSLRGAPLDEVHRRRADEAGDEAVGRALVDLARLAASIGMVIAASPDAEVEVLPGTPTAIAFIAGRPNHKSLFVLPISEVEAHRLLKRLAAASTRTRALTEVAVASTGWATISGPA